MSFLRIHQPVRHHFLAFFFLMIILVCFFGWAWHALLALGASHRTRTLDFFVEPPTCLIAGNEIPSDTHLNRFTNTETAAIPSSIGGISAYGLSLLCYLSMDVIQTCLKEQGFGVFFLLSLQ